MKLWSCLMVVGVLLSQPVFAAQARPMGEIFRDISALSGKKVKKKEVGEKMRALFQELSDSISDQSFGDFQNELRRRGYTEYQMTRIQIAAEEASRIIADTSLTL